MMRRFATAAVLLLLAAPLAAQGPSALKMRIDASTEASDPDDVPNVTITTVGSGFQVNTGPAAVLWEPAHSAAGAYTLKGKFTLQKPSGHTNYYGLVFGGSDLADAKQTYTYFLVAQDGTFLVKHRNGTDVRDVVGKTRHESVVRPNAAGTSVNNLEVRVGAQKIDYVVNGTVVTSTPKTGMTAQTDGIWGVRINHVLPGVLVEGLTVTK
jgi:hypothetical protein